MSERYEITFEFETETVTIPVGADEYLLDAGHDADLPLPFSCRNGNCTSCVGELCEGTIDQSDGMALEPEQIEDGYALLCSAYPRSDCTVRAGERIQEELLGLDLF